MERCSYSASRREESGGGARGGGASPIFLADDGLWLAFVSLLINTCHLELVVWVPYQDDTHKSRSAFVFALLCFAFACALFLLCLCFAFALLLLCCCFAFALLLLCFCFALVFFAVGAG